MKYLMIALNGIIVVSSVVSTIWCLATGRFGIAWICASCGAFGYGNFYTILGD